MSFLTHMAACRNPVLLLEVVSLRERMGSGGLQGLQILWSGASGVRGGFDSHAFPPILWPRRSAPARIACVALLAVLLAAGVPGGSWAKGGARKPVPGGPYHTLADSLAAIARADSVAAARDARHGKKIRDVQVVGGANVPADSTHRHWSDQPRFVMARSLLVPGWGQLHNHAWIKAAVVAGVEGLLIGRILDDQRQLDRLLGEVDVARHGSDADLLNALVNEYNDRLDQRLARQWLLGGVVAYALVDAYVDANFRGFDVEFRHDPALPQGAPAGGPAGGGDDWGVRAALRWKF